MTGLGADELIVFSLDCEVRHWARFVPPQGLARVRDRYRREAQRAEALCCEGALRAILGRLLSTSPPDVEILRTERGKPYVEADIGFSVSHAAGRGVLGVARRRRVGIDVETARREVDVEALAEGFFPSAERDEILAAAPEDRRLHALRAFTRLESAAKATGVGLSVPADEHETLCGTMICRHVDVGEGWVACVTADAPEFTVHVVDARSWIAH